MSLHIESSSALPAYSTHHARQVLLMVIGVLLLFAAALAIAVTAPGEGTGTVASEAERQAIEAVRIGRY